MTSQVKTARVYVSIGSNIDPVNHIQTVLQELRQHYGKLIVSAVYESEAVGFSGDNFYNLVAGFDTSEDPYTVVNSLQQLEQAHGRKRQGKSFKARTLDLDLLWYEQAILADLKIPREDILKYAFVLSPLAEIAPTARYPLTGQTFAELWKQFDKEKQTLWKVVME